MKKKENRQIDWRTIQSKALDACYELTDDYSDQIFTGKLLTAYRTHDFHPLERASTRHTNGTNLSLHDRFVPFYSCL